MATTPVYGWEIADGPDAPNVPYALTQLATDIENTLVGAGAPIGAVIAYGGSTAPTNWHLCDGTAHGSTALQGVLGSSLTPDLRGRFVLAAAAGHPAGQTGGVETHTLTVGEMPPHSHTMTVSGEAAIGGTSSQKVQTNAAGPFAVTGNIVGINAASTGGGAAHNNMPPFYALTYIIKKA
jgi:microcystin-dependent protein